MRSDILCSTTRNITAAFLLIAALAAAHERVLAGEATPQGCATPPPSKAGDADKQASQNRLKLFAKTATVLVAPVGTTQHVELIKDTAFQILNTGVATVSTQTGNALFLDIKGEHQGDTILRLTRPDSVECVDVGIIVKPPANPFVLTVGVGTSTVPRRTIAIVPSSPSIDPVGTPAAGATTVNRAVLTEDSKSQATSFSALGHVRFTNNTYGNWYGTLGALGGDGGIVYGVSYGANDALFLTLALHSANFTDFAPGYSNNAIVPTGVNQVTLTRRQTGVIVSISVPISILGGNGFLGAGK
jgi:hypothetical protein